MYVNGKNTVVKDNATTPDIIEALLKIAPVAVDQCRNSIDSMIYKSYDPLIDAEKCCRYIRSNVKYKADGFSEQNIQLPGRMFLKTKQADCKSFSLAFVGMMTALGHDVGFRFASYRKNKIPTHVYNFVVCNGKKYTFDSCVENLKESPRYTFIKDMKVQYLSKPNYIGLTQEEAAQIIKTAEARGLTKAQIRDLLTPLAKQQDLANIYNTRPDLFEKIVDAAKLVSLALPRNAFRLLVSFNFRGLASRLDDALKKDRNKIKNFWEELGGKFDGGDSLIQSINTGKGKKPLLGEGGVNGIGFYVEDTEASYIGIEPVTTTAGSVATATPILLKIREILDSLGLTAGDVIQLVKPSEERAAQKLPKNFVVNDPQPGSNYVKPSQKTGFSLSPLMIGGIVGGLALVYFLTMKKK